MSICLPVHALSPDSRPRPEPGGRQICLDCNIFPSHGPDLSRVPAGGDECATALPGPPEAKTDIPAEEE